MRTSLLFSLLLCLLSVNAFAEQTDNIKRIRLRKVINNSTQPRSFQLPEASACFNPYDAILQIDLYEVYDKVTISVRNAQTNETVISELYLMPSDIVIDMSTVDPGDFILEISFKDTLLLGEFSIE